MYQHESTDLVEFHLHTSFFPEIGGVLLPKIKVVISKKNSGWWMDMSWDILLQKQSWAVLIDEQMSNRWPFPY